MQFQSTVTQLQSAVVGLGDPVMDLVCPVLYEQLAFLQQEPGGCLPVSPAAMRWLISVLKTSEMVRVPGGSAANVVKGMAAMSSSRPVKFVGMVGNDDVGMEYRSMLAKHGVEPLLLQSTTEAPSAIALCLVTAVDGQRTMRTCLGAASELVAASQVPAGWTHNLHLLHCEGYSLYRPSMAKEMMAIARKVGASISLDLASFELVRNCSVHLSSLLQAGLVDIIFANEEEAVELSRVHKLAPAAAAVDVHIAATQAYLLRYVQVAVISLGSKGCNAVSRSGEVGSAPAREVQVVDTVGAGDCFTAGFLTAWLQGASLMQCAAAGCAAGAEAVQAVGAGLSTEAAAQLRATLADILEVKNSTAPAVKQEVGAASPLTALPTRSGVTSADGAATVHVTVTTMGTSDTAAHMKGAEKLAASDSKARRPMLVQ